jgi:hypothetical protein
VPKTAPKGAVFCHLFTGTETYAVRLLHETQTCCPEELVTLLQHFKRRMCLHSIKHTHFARSGLRATPLTHGHDFHVGSRLREEFIWAMFRPAVKPVLKYLIRFGLHPGRLRLRSGIQSSRNHISCISRISRVFIDSSGT